jgi:hypothetical protein
METDTMASKDAHYLRHDYNAANDPKILRLRMKHGAEGYGIYWMLCEYLRQQKDGKAETESIDSFTGINQLCTETTKDVIYGFELFETDETCFFSPRLNRDTEKYNSIKEKRIEAGRKGGQANAKQNTEQTTEQTSSSKVKNSKEKKSKEEKYKGAFELFWKTYPSRNGKKLEKGKTEETYFKIHERHYGDIIRAVRNYAEDKSILEGIGIRDPKRFLKDDYWKEYLSTTTQTGNAGKTAEAGSMQRQAQGTYAWLTITDGKEVWTNPTQEQIDAHRTRNDPKK